MQTQQGTLQKINFGGLKYLAHSKKASVTKMADY